MTVRLGAHRYGKAGIRVMKVDRSGRHGAGHRVLDLTVEIRLAGDFSAAHGPGDNALVVPTDTMKNTVYGLARTGELEGPEAFALRLARHFLASYEQVAGIEVEVAERPWQRIAGATGDAGDAADFFDDAFVATGSERRLAWVVARRGGDELVRSGVTGLLVLKTGKSGFSGFPRDHYTTLRETDDRLFATVVEADWRWRPGTGAIDFSGRAAEVRRTLLAAFAAHDSRSVQHTLWAMGEAALGAVEEIEAVHLVLPNKHHLLADLSPFGLDNPNDVFVVTDEPYGRIEATVERGAESA